MTLTLKLTPNFSLNEFVAEGDTPDHSAMDNLINLANRLQVLRDLFGDPIKITSGYRSPEHNKKIGGKENSYHLHGMAADIVVEGWNARDVQLLLKDWSGGLGCYVTFTHVDIRPTKARW